MLEPLLVAGLLLLFGMIAGCFYGMREQRRMLREIRKLAALYPPFPVSDEDGTKPGTTSVFIEEQWKDDAQGRD